MYCWNCGKKIEDGSRFCVYCGVQMNKNDFSYSAAADKNSEQNKVSSKNRKSRKNVFAIAVAVLVILAGFSAAFVVFFRSGKSENSTSVVYGEDNTEGSTQEETQKETQEEYISESDYSDLYGYEGGRSLKMVPDIGICIFRKREIWTYTT